MEARIIPRPRQVLRGAATDYKSACGYDRRKLGERLSRRIASAG